MGLRNTLTLSLTHSHIYLLLPDDNTQTGATLPYSHSHYSHTTYYYHQATHTHKQATHSLFPPFLYLCLPLLPRTLSLSLLSLSLTHSHTLYLSRTHTYTHIYTHTHIHIRLWTLNPTHPTSPSHSLPRSAAGATTGNPRSIQYRQVVCVLGAAPY